MTATVHDSYVIWGSSGHARVLRDLIGLLGGSLAALFDNDPDARTIADEVPLYIGQSGFRTWLDSADARHHRGLVAIGGSRGRDRLDLHRLLTSSGFDTSAIVHPDAAVARSARIGPGSQLLALSMLAADASVGEACILNHKASVDHECVLGDGVHLAPGVTICGCVALGPNVFVGAGACILPRVSVGANTIVGAGSIVTADLPAGVVAWGQPARIIRANS